jgi:alanine racemase
MLATTRSIRDQSTRERSIRDEPLLVTGSVDINSSVQSDAVVQKNGFLHVRGNLLGNLTIEPGARVIIDGSVDGKIVNKGGRLEVHNKGLAAYVKLEGPPAAEACGILRVNLAALAANWETASRQTEAECAAVVKANAYGCGIEPIAGTLAKSGCMVFFVSNIPEARTVRAAAPGAVIYVLNGFYAETAPLFCALNARPVINSSIELAEWQAFARGQSWSGGCALNVDLGSSRLGIPLEEAAAIAMNAAAFEPGISLLLSRLDCAGSGASKPSDRQIGHFRDLRRLFQGVPASLASSSGLFGNPKIHFELVRAGGALYGVNPVPDKTNPMRQVIELQARIVQVRRLGNRRIAAVSCGYADGYPLVEDDLQKLKAQVGGELCPVAGRATLDLLPIDITRPSNAAAAQPGALVTLIGDKIPINELAAAAKMSGSEVLSRFGSRLHRIYCTL